MVKDKGPREGMEDRQKPNGMVQLEPAFLEGQIWPTMSLARRQDMYGHMSFVRPCTHPHLAPAVKEEGRRPRTKKRIAFLLPLPCNFPAAPSTDKASIVAANKGAQSRSHKARQGRLHLGLRNNKLITGMLSFLSNKIQDSALLVVFLNR